jgi:hypothetical protein
MATAKEKWIQNKIKRIYKEGIHGKAPVKGQAYAVANSMYKRK